MIFNTLSQKLIPAQWRTNPTFVYYIYYVKTVPRFAERLTEVYRLQTHHFIPFNILEQTVGGVHNQVPSQAAAWKGDVNIGPVKKRSLLTPPHSQIAFRVMLPAKASFHSFVALGPELGDLHDSLVEFILTVRTADERRVMSWTKIVDPISFNSQQKWIPFHVNLADFAGCEVEMILSVVTSSSATIKSVLPLWGEPSIQYPQSVAELAAQSGNYFREHGLKKTFSQALQILKQTRIINAEIERQRHEAPRLEYQPLISVLTPVYNTDPVMLRAAIESVRNQTYPRWELCLVNDGSTHSVVSDILNEYAAKDARIKVKHRAHNGGIVAASNDAFSMATGEFIALLDHDDELTPGALYAVAHLLNQHPDADMIYTDEDKLYPDGTLRLPFLKPDWSPEFFLSCMYTCHLSVYRRSLVSDIGAFREGFDGAQDYDLALRIIERTQKIYHIPQILYHWRLSPQSTALNADAKPYAYLAAKRAIDEYLCRNRINATCEDGYAVGHHRVRYHIVGQPLVSIIIPTAGVSRLIEDRKIDLLPNCLQSIIHRTDYKNYEIVCIDNGDLREETKNALSQLSDAATIRLITFTRPFNLADKMNFGAEHARGEHFLFLNDDTEILSGDWLASMLEFSQQREIGVVGAKLYFPGGALQHAGVTVLDAAPGHIYYGSSKEKQKKLLEINVIRNYSAVTGACMMTRRDVFEEVKGFNEVFPVNYNDIDYCLKVRERGYRIVFTPYAELLHFESLSRVGGHKPEELKLFQEIWSSKVPYDPYFNPRPSLISMIHETAPELAEKVLG